MSRAAGTPREHASSAARSARTGTPRSPSRRPPRSRLATETTCARALLDAARRIASRASNRVVDAGVELHGASVELLAATGAERERAVDSWRAKIARYGDAGDPLGEVVATSFEARFALRVAQRTLAAAGERRATRILRLDRGGAWFAVDGGPRVDLRRRGALRRILAALATRRDQGIKQAELAEIGWPGERVLVDAASTRVRVAIATLRQLGLRSLLITRDDGYALDAQLELV